MDKRGTKKWQLVWQDDFEGTELDPTVWSRCERGKPDWCNTMSPDPDLVTVADSVVRLWGIKNNDIGKDSSPYLTAGITSRGKYAFRYGKVEIKARFKSARGAWPALWMLGATGRYPHNGEIDLMEHLNFDDIAYQTIHSEYTLNIDKSRTPTKGCTAPIERDGWNSYGCFWDSESLTFLVNGEPTLTYPRMPERGSEQWPFDRPFYFILSMQIGGSWVNQEGPTEPSDYPAFMEIDWVKVYREG